MPYIPRKLVKTLEQMDKLEINKLPNKPDFTEAEYENEEDDPDYLPVDRDGLKD